MFINDQNHLPKEFDKYLKLLSNPVNVLDTQVTSSLGDIAINRLTVSRFFFRYKFHPGVA